MYVCGTSAVPVNLLLTIFPILGHHRLVKFPAQGRQFYVKSRWYGRSPLGKTIYKPGSKHQNSNHHKISFFNARGFKLGHFDAFSMSGIRKVVVHNFMKSRSRDG